MCQNKLLKLGVQTMVNSNKINIKPNGDLFHETHSHYNANFLDNQDPCSQNENDKSWETR